MRLHRSRIEFPASDHKTWRVTGARTALVVVLLVAVVGFLLGPLPLLAQQPSPEFDLNQVPVPEPPPAAAFGARSYAENCAPCHGTQGMGDGPTAAELAGPPTAFADPDAVWERSPAELFHTTKFGRMTAMMPPWRNELSDDMIWHTVAYAWSLHTTEKETIQGADSYAGSCAGCHGETGAGDGLEASEGMQDLSDPAYAMAVSQAEWLAGWQEAHPEIGEEWTQAEQRQTLEYVRTFSQTPPWLATGGGGGVIRGAVVQGTPGSEGVGDAVVTLESFIDFQPMTAYTTTVAPDGSFEFTDLALDPNSADPGMVYLASVSEGGIRYSSPIVSLTAEAPAAETEITVYDVTEDPSGIVLDRVHWIIDSQPGALMVLQVLEIGNLGDRTYVGETVDGLDEPVTVAFLVPEEAVELNFENGALGQRFRQVGDLIYDTTPVVPGSGTRQIVMQYAVPYDGEDVSLAQPFEYPVSTLNLLVADQPGLEVDVPGLEPSGTRDFEGRVYYVWQAGNVGQDPVAVNLSGLLRAGELDPRAAETAGATSAATAAAAPSYEPWMAWMVALLAGVGLAGVVTWSWKQGRLTPVDTPEDLRAQHKELVQSIARLDDLHALGEVSDGTWQAQRAQLKNKLLEVDGRLASTSRQRK